MHQFSEFACFSNIPFWFQGQGFGSDFTSSWSLLVINFYLKSWDKKINKTPNIVYDFCLACFGIIITHYKIYSNITYVNKQSLNNWMIISIFICINLKQMLDINKHKE